MSRSLDLSDLRVFNSVARTSSFSAAARAVGLSRSTVSKKVARLEQHLGVALFNRSTRHVRLTGPGQILFDSTDDATASIERALDAARASDTEPTGIVRMSVGSGLTSSLIPALASRLLTAYPQINIGFDSSGSGANLIGDAYDLALVVANKLDDSGLVSRRIATTPKVLAASPGYLQENGAPRNLEDLQDHRCLDFSIGAGNSTIWRFRHGDRIIKIDPKPQVFGSDLHSLLEIACSNYGVIFQPRIALAQMIEQRRLQTLLRDAYEPELYGIYLMYPRRNVPNRVRLVAQQIEEQLRSWLKYCD